MRRRDYPRAIPEQITEQINMFLMQIALVPCKNGIKLSASVIELIFGLYYNVIII